MFAINFYEKKEDKIAKPLKTRKGICENYASLFTDICIKSGLKSFVIEGYTSKMVLLTTFHTLGVRHLLILHGFYLTQLGVLAM